MKTLNLAVILIALGTLPAFAYSTGQVETVGPTRNSYGQTHNSYIAHPNGYGPSHNTDKASANDYGPSHNNYKGSKPTSSALGTYLSSAQSMSTSMPY